MLIDGPSGAGKSSLADAVVGALSTAGETVALVRLDDIYPGWGGLSRASAAIATELLAPLRAVGRGEWTRWDWAARARAEAHELDASGVLVVEGCGAITDRSATLADCSIWVEADDEVRKRRALARDEGRFDEHWDEWQRQFDAHVVAQRPRSRADLVADATNAIPTTVVLAHLRAAHGLG